MICLDCGVRLEVVKTMVMPDSTQRLRQCQCGSRFLTVEKVARRLPVLPATTRQPPGNGPPTTPQPPGNAGGVGGGVSSGQVPIRISDPNSEASLLSGTRARARERKPVEESPEFDRLWAGNRRVGRRFPALKAWRAAGCPDVTKLIELWDAWMRTDDWKRGAVPYLSTWINQHGWKDDPAVCAPKRAQTPALAPWEERQRRAREEAQERERIASRRAQEQVDRKVAEMRKYQEPAQQLVASLANGKAAG